MVIPIYPAYTMGEDDAEMCDYPIMWDRGIWKHTNHPTIYVSEGRMEWNRVGKYWW